MRATPCRLSFGNHNLLIAIKSVNHSAAGNPLSWENFLFQNALQTLLFEAEQTSLLQLITRVSQV